MFLYFCDDVCSEWAYVVNVKCDLQTGRVQCVVSKVRWSVVLQCHILLCGLQYVSFLHKVQYFMLLVLEQ